MKISAIALAALAIATVAVTAAASGETMKPATTVRAATVVENRMPALSPADQLILTITAQRDSDQH